MNLFAIDEENVHLPDGQVYMLWSYLIEQPQPLQYVFLTKLGQDKDPFSSAPLSFPLMLCIYICIVEKKKRY